MGRRLVESSITTANARRSLGPGIHWRAVDADVHLGYRKTNRFGVWMVRWRTEAGEYRQAKLGTADDTIKVGTLSYDDALREARKHVEAMRTEAIAAGDSKAPTVRSAVEAYIADRDARDSRRKGREVRSDAGQRLGRYILGQATRGEAPPPEAAVASIPLQKLRESDLRDWMLTMPSTMAASSRQRTATDFKAALNAAADLHHERLPPSVPEVIRRGLRVKVEERADREVARASQILTDAQITRLLAEARKVDAERRWEGDLYRLMVVLAATGMRFAQVARMKVRDVQRENRRLLVPVSRKGRGIKEGFTAVPVGPDVMEELLPVTVGREPDEFLLERWRYGQAPGSVQWMKDKRGPWKASAEFSRDWQTIKKRAELPEADPYAFRHSSIVRAIRANLPIRLVAARHDTSIVMIERHYSRWIVDGLEDLLAAAVVPLVPVTTESNIVRLA